MDDLTPATAYVSSTVAQAPCTIPDEIRWEKFGKYENLAGDQPDPQRHIFTSCIFRAGASALAVISEGGVIDSEKAGETGLYVDDMRVVSKLALRINGEVPAVVD